MLRRRKILFYFLGSVIDESQAGVIINAHLSTETPPVSWVHQIIGPFSFERMKLHYTV